MSDQQPNVINYNPIFPTLTASIDLDLPVAHMARDLLQMEVPNYEGGFTTFYTNASLDHITGFRELKETIHGVSCAFMQELKYEVDPDRCGIQIWANIMRKGGHHGMHMHSRSHVSGTFYVMCDDTTSPFVFHNPTNSHRTHEPLIRDPENLTAFTSSELVIPPQENKLVMWPSWLYHHVPKMDVDGPRISISFNVDYLPVGL